MDLEPVTLEKSVWNVGSSIYNVEHAITLASPEAEIFNPPILLLDTFSEHLPAPREDLAPPRRRVCSSSRRESDDS